MADISLPENVDRWTLYLDRSSGSTDARIVVVDTEGQEFTIDLTDDETARLTALRNIRERAPVVREIIATATAERIIGTRSR